MDKALQGRITSSGPLDRRRRSGAPPAPPRRKPGGKSGDHQRSAAANGKDGGQSGGLPKEVFDGLQAQLAANRAQFYYELPAGPFYGYNRPGAKASQGVIWNLVAPGHDTINADLLIFPESVTKDAMACARLTKISSTRIVGVH